MTRKGGRKGGEGGRTLVKEERERQKKGKCGRLDRRRKEGRSCGKFV